MKCLCNRLCVKSVLGYNVVVRIPAGATNIDVRQHSYSGKPEDDNYLGELQCVFQSRVWLCFLVVLIYLMAALC